jgi:membrane-associated protein
MKTYLQFLDPEYLIRLGGIVMVNAIVFAETGLMIGFFLPGDSLLFTTGLLVATGVLDVPLWVVLFSLTLSAIIGDQVGYWIGRRVGKSLFEREDSLLFKKEYVYRTQAFYDRHGGKAIVLGRFVPIVRTFVPVLAGVANYTYRFFVFYNISGAIIWIFSMTLAGYLLGTTLPGAKKYLELIIGIIILLSLLPIVRTYIQERRLAKQKAESEVEL